MENTKKWFEFKGGKLAVIDIESGYLMTKLVERVNSMNAGIMFDNTMYQILHDINGNSIVKKKSYQCPTTMHEDGLVIIIINEQGTKTKAQSKFAARYYYGTWDKPYSYEETYDKSGKTIDKEKSEKILSMRRAIDNAIESYYMSFSEVSICGPFVKSRYNNLRDYIAFLDDTRFTFPEMFDYSSDKYLGLEYMNSGKDILFLEYLRYLHQLSTDPTNYMTENDIKNIFKNWIESVRRYEKHDVQTCLLDVLYGFDVPYKNIDKLQVGTIMHDVVKYTQHFIDRFGTVISIDYPAENKYCIYTLSKSKDQLTNLVKFTRDVLDKRGVQYTEWNTTT